MSKEFRLEVGAQGLSTLIEVLATDTSNSDIPLKLNQAILGLYIDIYHRCLTLGLDIIEKENKIVKKHSPSTFPERCSSKTRS